MESTLLSQVRVANIGQEIDVWVLGRTRVRLKVGGPYLDSGSLRVSYFMFQVSLDPSSTNVLLLGTNSEVSIAPKLRSNTKHGGSHSTSSTRPARLHGQNGTASQKSEEDQVQQKKPTKILRVLSRRALPPDLTLPNVSTDLNVAFVSWSSLASLIELPRSIRDRSCWRITVRRLRPPVDPTQEPHVASPQTAPTPRVLIPNEETSPSHNAANEADTKDETNLVCTPGVPVPHEHILLQEAVDGIEDWDLVR